MCASTNQLGLSCLEQKKSKETFESIFQKLKEFGKLSSEEVYEIMELKELSPQQRSEIFAKKNNKLARQFALYLDLQSFHNAVEKGDVDSKAISDKIKIELQKLFRLDENVLQRGPIKLNINCKFYHPKVLSDIIKAAIILILNTSPDDIILLPGRSCIQIGHAIKLMGVLCPKLFRKVFMPAFSNGSKVFGSNKQLNLTPALLATYEEYLETVVNLRAADLASVKGKIVVMDYVDSGDGLLGFMEVIRHILNGKRWIDISQKFSPWRFESKSTIAVLFRKMNFYGKIPHSIIVSDKCHSTLINDNVPNESFYFSPGNWTQKNYWQPRYTDSLRQQYQEMEHGISDYLMTRVARDYLKKQQKFLGWYYSSAGPRNQEFAPHSSDKARERRNHLLL